MTVKLTHPDSKTVVTANEDAVQKYVDQGWSVVVDKAEKKPAPKK